MAFDVAGDSTREGTNDRGFDRSASVTRSLLGYGVLAGPLYLAVGLVQASVRDGFDLRRHALSLLANGPGGWIQTTNFVLSGLMVIAAAVGFARVLGTTSRALPGLVGAFGASMIMAAVFPADSMDGFPVGTPMGSPTSVSATGLLHFIAGTLGFVSLSASCFFAARAMSRLNVPSAARFSNLSGFGVALGFFGGFALPVGTLGIWLAVVVGWAWLTTMSLQLYRLAPKPNC